MRGDDGRERLCHRVQFGAVHQRDGAGAAGARFRIVIIEKLLAVGPQVGLGAAEHVPRKGLVDHAVGEDFRGRSHDIAADVLKLPGHLDRAHQAGIEDEVVELHGDGVHEVAEFQPADVFHVADVLVADGFGGGPHRRIGMGFRVKPGMTISKPGVTAELPDAGGLCAALVTPWDPAGSVGREEHAVGARGEHFLNVQQGPPERIRGGAERYVGVGLEGVGDGLAVGAAQQADELRRVGGGVVAAARRVVAEGHDGAVAREAGEDAFLDVREVGQQVAAEVIVA